MWADFKDLCPHTGLYEPQVWAAALVENFLEINDKRAARQKPFLLETFGVPHRDLTRAYMEIRNQLKLEPSDPRYLDEMGFLMLFQNLSRSNTMICKHCGLEYPDDLEACPGCGTLNEEGEAQVMSEEERDAFDGVTIETGTDEENRGDWKVYDREDIRKEQEKEARKENGRRSGKL